MRIVVGLLLVLAACSRSAPAPSPTRATESPAPRGADPLAGIVEAHNEVRRSARPVPSPTLVPLVEAPELIAAARQWAKSCSFRHAETASGENLYAATQPPSAHEVVASWAAEAADYDLQTGRCRGTCGHYTQIVWRATRRVGCALERCTRSGPFGNRPWWLVVCRYEPAGNWAGERPY